MITIKNYKDKIVFRDNGQDTAIKGLILKEDEFFITIAKDCSQYTIAKNRVVCIERNEIKRDDINEKRDNKISI